MCANRAAGRTRAPSGKGKSAAGNPTALSLTQLESFVLIFSADPDELPPALLPEPVAVPVLAEAGVQVWLGQT
jgi:hypothetical protein